MTDFTITQTSPKDDKLYLYPEGNLSGCIAWTADSDSRPAPILGSNYLQVNENRKTPDYGEGYVSMATDVYTTDQYSLPDSVDLGTINYVKVTNMVRIDSPPSSDNEYYIALTSDSICTHTYLSSNQNLTTGWAKKSHVWELEPSASTAWSWTDINNLTIGMKAKSPEDVEYGSVTIRPNASTATTEWTPVGETENYECVDEVNANDDTDYVHALDNGIGNEVDIYELENVDLPVGAIIDSVVVYGRGKCEEGALYEYFSVGLYLNGTYNYSTFGLKNTLSWKTYSATHANNPEGNPWTEANLNNTEIVLFGEGEGTKITQVYCLVNYHIIDSEKEIQVSQVYAEVGYTPSTSTCYLNKPETISTDHARNTKMFNFWTGDREVYDYNRTGKSMVLKGREFYSSSRTTPCSRITCVRDLGRNGAVVTIDDLNPNYFNGNYRIRQFAWKKISENPEHYEWMLQLEDDES